MQGYFKNWRQSSRTNWATRLGTLVHSAKERAKKNKLVVELDRAWIERTAKKLEAYPVCPVTGVTFDLAKPRFRGAASEFAPSIDRINPNKGYTKRNTRIVSVWANRSKGVLNDAAFEAWVLVAAKAIQKRQKGARDRSRHT
jgi:hypothetical protein